MKVTYRDSKNEISKEIAKSTSFLTINLRKDFVHFYDVQKTRYEGFYVKKNNSFIKLLSRFVIEGFPTEVEKDINDDSCVLRKYSGGFEERFRIAKNDSVLIYELSNKSDINVRLDIRDIFAVPHWNRKYEVKEYEDGLIVKYQDDCLKNVYIALNFKGELENRQNWIPFEYIQDKERGSQPFILYEFELAKIRTRKIVLAYADSQKQAVALAAKYSLKRFSEKVSEGTIAHDEKSLAYKFCEDTICELDHDGEILAGLPWFGKVWTRDELLSALALNVDDRARIIRKYLNIGKAYNGRLPIIFGGRQYCDDSIGILAWLINNSEGLIKEKDYHAVVLYFEKAEKYFDKKIDESGLISSAKGSDWMDTIDRDGHLIEIQALYIQILEVLYKFSKDEVWEFKRKQFIRLVRKNLNGGFILDNQKKLDKRPNIFLAAFFAPEMFENKEWEKTFDVMLTEENIWNRWGGISTLGHKDKGFTGSYKGESNESYHQGDSWFFVNNIAAMVLYDLNRDKYRVFIEKLYSASVENILWQHALGGPSEISSSDVFEGVGSPLQAFSAATYIYLYRKLNHTSLGGEVKKIMVKEG